MHGVLARVGEVNIEGLDSLARVLGANVVDRHVWERVERSIGATAASDGDWSAVHVHFAIANDIVPGPGEDVVPGGYVLWNWNVIRGSRAASARTSTKNRVDHLELRVWRKIGWSVLRERDLARAAVVNCGALEAHLNGRANGSGVLRAHLQALPPRCFARIVGSSRRERRSVWRTDCAVARVVEGHGLLHRDVRRDRRGERASRGDRVEELHDDAGVPRGLWVDVVVILLMYVELLLSCRSQRMCVRMQRSPASSCCL